MLIKLSWPTAVSPPLADFVDEVWQARTGVRFTTGDSVKRADAWVIFDDVNPADTECRVPPDRVFFASAEQSHDEDFFLDHYWKNFFGQFERVHSPFFTGTPNSIPALPFLPWMVVGGHGPRGESSINYRFLDTFEPPIKSNRVSVICSTKTFSAGHRVRLRFVQILKEELGVQLDWFGFGRDQIEDKWDALVPYRFSIAVENQIRRDVVTEKAYDPLLAYTAPLYAGAPNVRQHLAIPEKWCLDVRDPYGSAARIQSLLESKPDDTEQETLLTLRQTVLERLHFLKRVSHEIVGRPSSLAEVDVRLFPRGYGRGFMRRFEERLESRLRRRRATLA